MKNQIILSFFFISFSWDEIYDFSIEIFNKSIEFLKLSRDFSIFCFTLSIVSIGYEFNYDNSLDISFSSPKHFEYISFRIDAIFFENKVVLNLPYNNIESF